MTRRVAVAKWGGLVAGFAYFVPDNLCVASAYRLVDREQPFLLPPSLREWLAADHLVWFLISAVAELDTSGFHRRRVQAGVGRPAYDPDMLLTLLIYAYAHGVRSSRRIEQLCATDVAFRVICVQDRPDHTTIARFRADHEADVEVLFTEVLVVCARAGLGRLGVVALDGTKIAANASRQANRSEPWLREQVQNMLKEAAAVDAAEDAAYGATRGDELPEELVDPTSRTARIRRCLDELAAERATRERAERDEQHHDRRDEHGGPERTGSERGDRDAAEGAEPTPTPHAQSATEERAESGAAERAESGAAENAESVSEDPNRPGTALMVRSKTDLVVRSRGDLERAVQQAEARLADTWERVCRRWAGYQLTRRMAAQGVAKLPDGRPPVPPEQHVQVRQLQRVVANARRRLATSSAHETERADTPTRSHKRAVERLQREPRRNLTDPDSRLLPSRHGWVQGYNAQLVVSDDHLILATSISQSPADVVSFQPMMSAAERAAETLAKHRQAATIHDDDRIGVLLADAGYASPDNLTTPGPDRLIAIHNRHRASNADPAPDGPITPRQHMQRRLATPEAAGTYKRRGAIVEPVIGHLKDTVRLRQFARRGLTAANAELAFAGLTLNLVKLYRTAQAT
jgi:transposase